MGRGANVAEERTGTPSRGIHRRMTIEQALAWQGQGEGAAAAPPRPGSSAEGDSVRKTTDQYAHLIHGTTVRDKDTGDVLVKVDAFGSVPVEHITARLIRTWKSNLGNLIRDGHYRPSTSMGGSRNCASSCRSP